MERIRKEALSAFNVRPVEQLQAPERLSKAFTQRELKEITGLLSAIRGMRGPSFQFFMIALLWTAKEFSRAVSDGGWLRWYNWPDRSREMRDAFEQTVSRMTSDLEKVNWDNNKPPVQACFSDARHLPIPTQTADGLITSPPYANRHDYSRVFHIDLLLMGVQEPEITKLRHQTIRSHVEAKPLDTKLGLRNYTQPEQLKNALSELAKKPDRRVERMIEGYFQDIYLSLTEVARILKPGGRAAYVVGNVRHKGVMVPADEIISKLASQAGLTFDRAWTIRLRGNSAQQMGRFGRQPSRESVVFMSKARHG